MNVIRLLHGSDEQGKAWRAVIREIAIGGDHDTALALTGAMENRPWRAKVRGMLALVRAGNGEYEQARSLAESVQYPHERLRTWALLAQTSAESGNLAWALEFLDRAEQTETLHDDWTLSALPILIRAAEVAGDHDRALVLVARLESVAHRESAGREALMGRNGDRSKKAELSDTPALSLLLQAVISVAEYERVGTLLGMVRKPADRAKATAAAVRALAQSGAADRAERLARSIKDSGHRARALAGVADAAALVRDTKVINAVGELVAESDEMANAGPIIAVAEAWAAVGAADRAEAWMQSISLPALRLEARAAAAEALAAVGDIGRAEALARTLTDPELRAEALHRIVAALAEKGLTDRAEAVANAVQGPDCRARALAVVATHAEGPKVRRFVAPALEMGDWATVIETLARVEPTAVTAIAEESLRQDVDRQQS
ncbi:hypothetical protein ABZ079_04800 [Streptomyces sp. NPDC006314]|uniref:tetratricopeptide repeat protein n=1 Tax=Streptomyces sp. NPDC006314 TaxID=3154475 RepID=UPI0033A7E384